MIDPVFAQSGQMANHISNAPARACRYRHLRVTFKHEDRDSGADSRIVLRVH
jgi:hypothetical protein